jgi:hypothetical protein
VIITPIYDSFALAAPASFRAGIQTAINMLDAKFTANITIAEHGRSKKEVVIRCRQCELDHKGRAYHCSPRDPTSAPGILSGPMESRP